MAEKQPTALAGLTLAGFANEVDGPSPAPGGGSVAAYAGALGASLVGMVCHLTIGRKGFEDAEPRLTATLAAAAELEQRLLAAVDLDTDAYLQVARAYRLPKATPEDQAARQAAVTAAMRHAAEVPLATAEGCLAVLELAGKLSEGFNAAAASDLGVAVEAAMTGVRGGALNVVINLQYMSEDDPGTDELRQRIARVEERAEEVSAAARPRLRALAAGTSGQA